MSSRAIVRSSGLDFARCTNLIPFRATRGTCISTSSVYLVFARNGIHVPRVEVSMPFASLSWCPVSICQRTIAPSLAHRGSIVRQSPPKRPMTFEDMMQMKRLGDTAVSPDGKWLAYSVTPWISAKTRKRRSCGCRRSRACAGRAAPIKLAVAQPGDGGLQFAPDGHADALSFAAARAANRSGSRTSIRPRARRAMRRS